MAAVALDPRGFGNEPVSRAEHLKQERELNKLQAETPAQKRRLFAKLAKERSYMKEVADAFDFRIIGVENLPTGPAWILEGTPHPGYQAKSRYARMFPIERQKLADGSWVPKSIEARAQARTFLFFNHNFREEITYGNYRRSGAALAEERRR